MTRTYYVVPFTAKRTLHSAIYGPYASEDAARADVAAAPELTADWHHFEVWGKTDARKCYADEFRFGWVYTVAQIAADRR